MCFVLVMSNHQASNICDQLPAVKQPNVSEPGDLARPVLVRVGEAALETEGDGRPELPGVRRGE